MTPVPPVPVPPAPVPAAPLPPELRAAAALVFVADLDAPALDPADAHHLVDVLRLGPSETVAVADGRGAWRLCALRSEPYAAADGRAGAGPRRGGRGRAGRGEPGRARSGRAADVILEPAGPVERQPASSRPVTVAFAVAKGERTEWTVQKLTELGVDRIWPLLTERTVVRLDGHEAERRAERLRKIAREAAAQSRRPWLPEVQAPVGFAAAVAALTALTPLDSLDSAGAGAGAGHAALVAEPGGGSLAPTTTAILVGPEGGWSERELDAGLERINLGTGVLRAETAAVVAGTLLTALRGGAVRAP